MVARTTLASWYTGERLNTKFIEWNVSKANWGSFEELNVPHTWVNLGLTKLTFLKNMISKYLTPQHCWLKISKWILQGMKQALLLVVDYWNMRSPSHLFLAPRPRRLRKTRGPGTQFALQISFSLLCMRWSGAPFLLSNFAFCHLYITRNVTERVPDTILFLVEPSGGKFGHLFRYQKQQATSRCSVLFDHLRCVHKLT